MREMKFRSWINKLHAWADSSLIHSNGGFISYKNNIQYYNCDIEQYTGLKDKNGKEIYEGDIIHDKETLFSENTIVKWDDENTGFEPFTAPGYGGYEWDHAWPSHCEVLGNIHENPELIR